MLGVFLDYSPICILRQGLSFEPRLIDLANLETRLLWGSHSLSTGIADRLPWGSKLKYLCLGSEYFLH